VPVECFGADGSRKTLYKAARKASNKSIILMRLSLRNSRTPFDPPQARGIARVGLARARSPLRAACRSPVIKRSEFFVLRCSHEHVKKEE
jgi:hypothetical protein